MDIECCIQDYHEAVAANYHRVNRVELCSGLSVGGLTPSIALVEKCSLLDHIEVHVMIRPREGGFNYTDDNITIMRANIDAVSEVGAHGVVFGILDNCDNRINRQANERLVDFAKSKGLEATFHRAFDVLKTDALSDLDTLMAIGFDRLLTSGRYPKAIDGIEQIRKYVTHVDGRIEIMAGSGISINNAQALVSQHVDALHFTISNYADNSFSGLGYERSVNHQKLEGIITVIREYS